VSRLSNLPPGVTDAAIERAAGGYDEDAQDRLDEQVEHDLVEGAFDDEFYTCAHGNRCLDPSDCAKCEAGEQ
jgi:hypothetical protein